MDDKSLLLVLSAVFLLAVLVTLASLRRFRQKRETQDTASILIVVGSGEACTGVYLYTKCTQKTIAYIIIILFNLLRHGHTSNLSKSLFCLLSSSSSL